MKERSSEIVGMRIGPKKEEKEGQRKMHQGKNRIVVVVSAAAFLLIVKAAFRLVISFVCVC